MKSLSALVLISLVVLSVSSFDLKAEEEVSVKPKEAVSVKPKGTISARKKEAVEKGLKWLESVQKKDGSWSNSGFPALTALPLRAFLRGGSDSEDVIKKAKTFILGKVQDDGGIYHDALIPGRGGLSTFNTALCMTALHELDSKEHLKIVLAARKFLASSQLTGDENAGGFGYSGPGWFSSADMMNTSYVLEAMKVTREAEDHRPVGEEKVDIKKLLRRPHMLFH